MFLKMGRGSGVYVRRERDGMDDCGVGIGRDASRKVSVRERLRSGSRMGGGL